jgi:hypothetical protein
MNAECLICQTSLCKHGFCRDRDCPNAFDGDDCHCQDCAEAQHQERIANYYGGDWPQTFREEQITR